MALSGAKQAYDMKKKRQLHGKVVMMAEGQRGHRLERFRQATKNGREPSLLVIEGVSELFFGKFGVHG